ncbi:hypothetical protein Cs7R123_51360 [Catellatospora sp. TT07R-123]|uniref:hypothetical protein n=1 Tax=Catellatospora sp. TT07R-123 TaxID=2733863 RepID=UPI001B2B0311|nr:hypothetical protein [Catellatospora sp. TT07R-123]GHJ47794.1 hypothetical protein Cs7R123_51360 [Catellatospora sp. TT07R-123]
MNAEEMLARLERPLSPWRRVATAAAAIGGCAGAAAIGVLWATEPDLPVRTQVAFAALVAVGLAWAGYGVWALTRRTPLFARDRVVAGWLALGATVLLTGLVVAVTVARRPAQPLLLALVLALLALAVVNLVRARAARSALLRRKHELGG